MGAVAWAIRQRSVSHPRSSYRTCPIKASGAPTGFTVRHTESKLAARGTTSPSSKAHQMSGPFPQPALPGFDGHTTPSESRHGRRLRDVEAATLALDGSPPITRNTSVPTTPADRAGARVDCFPAHAAFPKWQEGRHPHCHFRGLLRLHSRYGPPDCSTAQKRPLSRGSGPAGYRPNRSSATRSIDNSLGGIFLPSDPRLRGALPAHGAPGPP